MPVELLTLVITAIICLMLPVLYSALYGKQVGVAGLTGDREAIAAPAGLAGRGRRAHANLVENLVPYAAIVLVASSQGALNGVTAVAAGVFLAARIVHAAAYLIGIPVVRTVAYNVGMIATLVIAFQIFA